MNRETVDHPVLSRPCWSPVVARIRNTGEGIVKIHVMLIGGAAALALLACDDATGPDTAVPSGEAAAQLEWLDFP